MSSGISASWEFGVEIFIFLSLLFSVFYIFQNFICQFLNYLIMTRINFDLHVYTQETNQEKSHFQLENV